jgi:hypothetical protein
MQLLVNFAALASSRFSVPKISSLVPDGEFFFARETVLVGFSGTHPLMAPSLNAQSTIAKRQAYKMKVLRTLSPT